MLVSRRTSLRLLCCSLPRRGHGTSDISLGGCIEAALPLPSRGHANDNILPDGGAATSLLC